MTTKVELPMNSREEVYERVRQAMKELFEVDPERLTPTTRLVDDLGLDSIDALDLAAYLEDLSPERVPEAHLRTLHTVDDVVTLVQALLDGKTAAQIVQGPPTS